MKDFSLNTGHVCQAFKRHKQVWKQDEDAPLYLLLWWYLCRTNESFSGVSCQLAIKWNSGTYKNILTQSEHKNMELLFSS